MSDSFSDTKFTLVLAHDSIAKATADIVEALAKNEQASIGARIIDADRYLRTALKDLADAFQALERK